MFRTQRDGAGLEPNFAEKENHRVAESIDEFRKMRNDGVLVRIVACVDVETGKSLRQVSISDLKNCFSLIKQTSYNAAAIVLSSDVS